MTETLKIKTQEEMVKVLTDIQEEIESIDKSLEGYVFNINLDSDDNPYLEFLDDIDEEIKDKADEIIYNYNFDLSEYEV